MRFPAECFQLITQRVGTILQAIQRGQFAARPRLPTLHLPARRVGMHSHRRSILVQWPMAMPPYWSSVVDSI